MAERKKTKVDPNLPRHERLSLVQSALRSEYNDVIGVGTKMKISPDIHRIATGSLMLDYAMGGGLPVGRITMFKGSRGSGKTTHAIRIAARAQGLCRRCYRPAEIRDVIPYDTIGDSFEVVPRDDAGKPVDPDAVHHWEADGLCTCMGEGLVPFPSQDKGEGKKAYAERLDQLKENSYEEFIVAWVDAEMVFEFRWAKILGIDERRLVFSRPETGEVAIDVIDPLLRTGAVDLLVIDSIAHLIPSVEVESSTYDQQQGAQARLVNKGVRKFVSAVAECTNVWRKTPTQIWINQERATMSQFGSGKVTPGGKGQGFATSVELECWAAKREVLKISAGIKGEEIVVPQSEELHFKSVKNKTFPPSIEGFYRQILTDVDGEKGKIDEAKQIYRYAGHFEIVTRDGKAGPLTCHLTGYTTDKVGDMTAHVDEHLDEVKAEILRILLLKEK